MKKSIPSVILAILLSVALLAAAIYLPATSGRLMQCLMQHYAPAEATGLPAADYPAMAAMITDYLRGGNTDFQYVYTLNGMEYLAFHDHEQQHMADVQELFRLCRFVMWLGGGVALCGAWLLRRGFSWRSFRWTLIAVFAAVTAVIVAAAVDFGSLFTLFHKIAFTNDLWLLDPRTDMLIRLMPLEFFISHAAIIGGLWLLGMVVLLVVSTIFICKAKKGSDVP